MSKRLKATGKLSLTRLTRLKSLED